MNRLQVSIGLAIACLALPGSAYAGQAVVWNKMAFDVAVPSGVSTGARLARTLAVMHLAMHDAVNNVDERYARYAVTSSSPNASADAAANAAAYGVLVRLFPASNATLRPLYDSINAGIPDGAAKTEGIALGDDVAARIVSLRATDGFANNPPYIFSPPAPGVFQRMPPNFNAPSAPFTGLPTATPFTLRTQSQFRIEPPPALTGEDYAADLNQVKDIGRFDSASRTADETRLALFWQEGSMTTAWNRIARPIVAARGMNLWDEIRAFALLNMAISDVAIAIFEAKYTYNFWRPVTAIRQADTDGNDATSPDASWLPLGGPGAAFTTTPVHPEYPGGHSGYCSAAGNTLTTLLGDDVAFTATSASLPGVTSSFSSFGAAADDCAFSRIPLGIHFKFTEHRSQNVGEQVSRWVVGKVLKPVKENPGHGRSEVWLEEPPDGGDADNDDNED